MSQRYIWTPKYLWQSFVQNCNIRKVCHSYPTVASNLFILMSSLNLRNFVRPKLFLKLLLPTSPRLLCISTNFRVLRTPESRLKHLFSTFFNLFHLFKHFSVNFRLKSRKNISKRLKKLCFKLLFKAGRQASTG